MTGRRNRAGNVTASNATVVTPATPDELRRTVVEAATSGTTIRVAGSGHSFAPLRQSDGIIINLASFAGIEGIDPEIELFRSVRRRFDPNGVFLNDHLRPPFV